MAADSLVPAVTPLTRREIEILEWLAQGCRYADVAQRLSIGTETVRTHAGSAMAKLGARTRTQAVAVAIRTGILSGGPDVIGAYQRRLEELAVAVADLGHDLQQLREARDLA